MTKLFDFINIQNFIDSAENYNTAKVYKHVFKFINEDIVKKYSRKSYWSKAEDLIIELNPNSPKQITTFCHILGLYTKWLSDKNIAGAAEMYSAIQGVDKKAIWKKSKPNARKKFISYEQYKDIIHDIELCEEYNPLYYSTLFACVYEGIYCDDMSVVKNLRAADIDENIVTLHNDDGYSYRLKISAKLAEQLRELAKIDIWERPNRYGICKVPMRGAYSDSVFKIEDRSTASDNSIKFTYYAKLRKIATEYIGYQLLPQSLFISGIMHRIHYLLHSNGIEIEEAFSDNCRNRTAHSVISAELLRNGRTIDVGNFREIVKGHIDVFNEKTFDDLDDSIFEELLGTFSITENIESSEFEEGEEILMQHLAHERNADVVNLAKLKFKEAHGGKLYCENCGFDFSEVYGERGNDFIEAHHIKPVSKMHAGDVTKVEDLVMLCCNCHKVVHLKKPWLTLRQLKKITRTNQ